MVVADPIILIDAARQKLEDGLHLAAQDLKYSSSTIQADLDRFQRQKVADIREMTISMAKSHRDWCKKVCLIFCWYPTLSQIAKRRTWRPGKRLNARLTRFLIIRTRQRKRLRNKLLEWRQDHRRDGTLLQRPSRSRWARNFESLRYGLRRFILWLLTWFREPTSINDTIVNPHTLALHACPTS